MYAMVLAAGLSSRMKEEKLLLPLEEHTILERSLETASRLCENVLVVTKPKIAADTAFPENVQVAINETPEAGLASSITVGIAWLKANAPECEGVLMLLADEVSIRMNVAYEVMEKVQGRYDAIIAVSCNGKICHPVAFGAAWFNQLAALKGDKGGSQILKAYPESVEYVEADDEGDVDIDTQEDYLHAVLQHRKLVLVRGAGDIATGSIHRLHEAGFLVAAMEIAHPTVIRRKVSYAQALLSGECTVEGQRAVLCATPFDMAKAFGRGEIPVFVDPNAVLVTKLRPDVVVDAILAKRNLGTTIDMAPVVVGLGPGFTAGVDCHAVVETMRGHTLGRVIYDGSAIPDTGIPGNIGGYTKERVMHAPASGVVNLMHDIGDYVECGECLAMIGDTPLTASLTGYLRGIIADGSEVCQGLKMADIDPRDVYGHCFSISDKALSIGGGTLEAVMHLLHCKM